MNAGDDVVYVRTGERVTITGKYDQQTYDGIRQRRVTLYNIQFLDGRKQDVGADDLMNMGAFFDQWLQKYRRYNNRDKIEDAIDDMLIQAHFNHYQDDVVAGLVKDKMMRKREKQ